jgi:hypothetical protein
MYDKGAKKVIYTLNIDNYAPEVVEITRPLLLAYADKIGAAVVDITERKLTVNNIFEPVYEKMQIYELAQELEADWNIYIDSDALIHPDFFDPTLHLRKDTVCHNGSDFACHRWKYDRFFKRDGRHIGSCNWFTMASDLCIELWHPIDDMTPAEAVSNIYPTTGEVNGGTTPGHLIDDYTLSRNIAKYGLKFETMINICKRAGYKDGNTFLFHLYNVPIEYKAAEMKKVLKMWGVN